MVYCILRYVYFKVNILLCPTTPKQNVLFTSHLIFGMLVDDYNPVHEKIDTVASNYIYI